MTSRNVIASASLLMTGLLALQGCGSAGDTDDPNMMDNNSALLQGKADTADLLSDVVLVDASMDGQTVVASVGDTVEVNLEGNPSTGYSWQAIATSRSLPVSYTDFVGTFPKSIGSGGMHTFGFEVGSLAAGGTHTATFAYFRPWEGAASALKTFTIHIQVNAQEPACQADSDCPELVAPGGNGFVHMICVDGQCVLPQPQPIVVNVDAGMDGQTVVVNVGDTVEVNLEGNPSTGYSWQAIATSPNLPVSYTNFIATFPESIGSGGMYTFGFEVGGLAAGGTHAATFAYFRSWEGAASALKTLTIHILVR